MNTIKRCLLLGVCAALLPAPLMARDYLKGQTAYKPIEESDTIPRGDFAEDYVYTTGSSGELAKRQRVETRVKQYMENLRNAEHDDSHGHSAEDFNALVALAQQGDARAITQVAEAYQYGIGTEKNEKLAVEWYKRSIEYGETQNYAKIGEMYRDYSEAEQQGFMAKMRNAVASNPQGNDVADDDEEARLWFEKGAALQDANSYMKLGEMYRDGAGGLQKDMKKANQYYDDGLRMKKTHDERMLQELEQSVRTQAEIEEGLRAPEKADVGPEDSGANTTTLVGDYSCSLVDMDSPTTQYKKFYEAYCQVLGDGEQPAVPQTVVVDGMSCDVSAWPANNSGKTFELHCG